MKKTRSLLRLSYCCYFLVAAAVTIVQSTEVLVGTTEKESENDNLAPEVAKAPQPEKEGAFVIAPETIKRFEESSEPAAPPSETARCRWGEHCPTEEKEEAQQQHTNVNKNNSASQQTTLPFVPPKKPVPEDIVDLTELVPHKPPEGFTLTARVYTDPTDKHAHFDSDSKITLPYWECGAVGSTTSPLQVKHAYFRHAILTTETTNHQQHFWQGTEYGPHPQLLIPLAPLEVALNSGESRTFDAGNVILLEDVLSPGHVIRGVHGEHLDALIVTLPQHYHHVGKDRVSLTHQNSLKKQQSLSQRCCLFRRRLDQQAQSSSCLWCHWGGRIQHDGLVFNQGGTPVAFGGDWWNMLYSGWDRRHHYVW